MLHHVSLEVAPDDVERSVEFFTLLGFEKLGAPDQIAPFVTWLEADGTQIHFIHTPEPTTPTLPAAAPPRRLTITYRAHNGRTRRAVVLLPHGYDPHHNPPIPLVISPHGRNADGKQNASYWGNLPAAGEFAVVNPDGMGRRLGLRS